MRKKKISCRSITHASIIIATLILSGCGGSAVVETVNVPNVVGDIVTVNGQTFTVTSMANDGSSITFMAPSSGFTQAILTFTLTRSPDDKYRYLTASISIIYDPITSVVSWSIASGISETDLVVEVLENSGASLIPGITSSANFSESTPSAANVSNLLSTEESVLTDAVNSVVGAGYTISSDVDLSYSNINVSGLEVVHTSGWTGLSTNVLVVDGIAGDSPVFGFNYRYSYGNELEFTHGMNTSSIIFAVAPEAEVFLEEVNTYFSVMAPDHNIDVVNFSYGWPVTASASLTEGLIDAKGFVVDYLEPLANANPNAVIVESAGNNGTISGLSESYNCIAAGNRNTADSCTDIKFSLDETLYSALNRTVFVGAYDTNADDLTSYSVSAGESAKDYFMVADGNSIIDFGVGTSYAAPRVAGVVALTVHKFPNLTAAERTLLILNTADDLGVAGVDSVYGHGLLNASAALNPVGMLN